MASRLEPPTTMQRSPPNSSSHPPPKKSPGPDASTSRDRDGISTLPRLPTNPAALPSSLRQQMPPSSDRKLHRALVLANRSTGVARGAWRGAYSREELGLRDRSSGEEWRRSSPTQREVVGDILRKHIVRAPPEGMMDGSAALRRAVGSASDGYSFSSDEVATVSKDECVEGRLPRGTICAASPSRWRYQNKDRGKTSPEEHSGGSRFFYERAKERIL